MTSNTESSPWCNTEMKIWSGQHMHRIGKASRPRPQNGWACMFTNALLLWRLFATSESWCAFVYMWFSCGHVRVNVWVYGQAWLRPLVVITFAVLFPFFLQVLQFRLIHHLLHQVFFSTHAIAQVFGHVRNHVGYEGLDAKHQMLNKRKDKNRSLIHPARTIFLILYSVSCFRNTANY